MLVLYLLLWYDCNERKSRSEGTKLSQYKPTWVMVKFGMIAFDQLSSKYIYAFLSLDEHRKNKNEWKPKIWCSVLMITLLSDLICKMSIFQEIML